MDSSKPMTPEESRVWRERVMRQRSTDPGRCPLCASHYGDNGTCDEGKPVNSPHRPR
jgi:hypothetical protein